MGEAAVLRDARQAACSCILLTGDFPDPGRRTAQDGWPLPSPGADSKTFCIPFKTLKWHLLWFINEAIGCASLQEDQCNFPFVGEKVVAKEETVEATWKALAKDDYRLHLEY